MGKIGFFDEAIEMVQEETGQAVKSVKQQITGKPQNKQAAQSQATQKTQQGQKQQPSAQLPQDASAKAQTEEAVSSQESQDSQTKDFVKDLYGGDKTAQVTKEELAQKQLEDKQKMEALRQRLHREYFEPLIKPPKPQEPRQREKIEKEEEQKKEELVMQEKKKKEEELPLIATKDKGTKERLRGVSG